MISLKKGKEPEAFTKWKALANDLWQPTYSDLQNPEKQSLQLALISEQGGLCCYCGRAISEQDSHIEHFRPQQAYKELELDYSNLFVSCIREKEPGAPLHCGHAKGSDFDEQKAISPLDEACEGRFIFSVQDGAIYPADRNDTSASYMIDLLKLNIEFLSGRRAEALKRVFDDEFISSATQEELAKLAKAFRQANDGGYRNDFAHVVSRYAEQLADQVL